MFNFDKTIIIKPTEIIKVITDHNLHIYKNIWHYSFNNDFQKNDFRFEKKKNGTKILYSNAYNSFSPLLIYTNVDSDLFLKVRNAFQDSFDELNKNYRHVFWYLKTITFKSFLERRSENSTNPKKHFPTIETYEKYKNKIKGEVKFSEFDKDFFIENYNNLKAPDHFSGEKILEIFNKNNPGINLNWFKTATLYHNNSIVAIGILIDDSKSLNLENIAAKRDALSFGVFLCTEIVKYCCENNYYSFDAGVSGLYGNYKEKIFLDSIEVYEQEQSLLKYIQFWKISYWKKINYKIFKNGVIK